jgi:hypothetical protein
MPTYQHSAFTVMGRYDTLYGGHKKDASVGVNILIDMDFASPQRCVTCS